MTSLTPPSQSQQPTFSAQPQHAAQPMEEATAYFGSKISLISKSEIRYDGVLHSVDTNQGTVTLQSGQFSVLHLSYTPQFVLWERKDGLLYLLHRLTMNTHILYSVHLILKNYKLVSLRSSLCLICQIMIQLL